MNPIDSGPVKVIAFGLEDCSKIFERFLKALEQRNKMFQNL